MSKSAAGPERVAAAERERKAVNMRLAGATFLQIATELGVTDTGAAQMVKRVMARTRKLADEDAETLRQREAERLDALQAAIWRLATGTKETAADLAAVDRVVKILARRAALLGLDAPARQELSGPDGGPVQVALPDEERQRLLDKIIADAIEKHGSSRPD